MFKFLALVNTKTGYTFLTGRGECKPVLSKTEIFEIAARSDASNNKNYAQWAKTLSDVNSFHYKFFYAETSEAVRKEAEDWVHNKNWKIYPSKSRPTPV
ncbi:hypothetical protein KW541_17120 [Vibrio fluvialis]|nr:hypothetical protein [Vibrio fluvialis]